MLYSGYTHQGDFTVEELENRLLYERNKYERMLHDKERGICEALEKDLKLDLSALRDIAEHVNEDDRRRIIRRLNRIEERLHEFCDL